MKTVTDLNANGSVRDRSVTTTSANGLSVTTQTDSNSDGQFDQTRTDVTVLNADGSRTETVTDLNADGSLRDRTVKTVTASGLSATTQSDLTGHGRFDRTHTDVTVLNADGSRTETSTDLAATGAVIDRTVKTVSANGLSVTTSSDPSGSGTAVTTTDVTVLNADGGRTETISDIAANGALLDRTVTAISASGESRTVSRDIDGDGHVDQTETILIGADGSRIDTVSDLNSDGSVKDRVVTTTAANGLVATIQRDPTGAGSFAQTETDVVLRKADGSQVETVTCRNADGSVRYRTVTTTSADGLSKTTQFDLAGASRFDQTQTDVTVLNADGSRTETVSTFKADNTLLNRQVKTVSANGLSTTTQWDRTGAGKFDQTATDVTVLNRDGSRTETITDLNADGTPQAQTIVTTSADGRTVTRQTRKTSDSRFDQNQTVVTTKNADGSATQTLTDTTDDGKLRDRAVTTTSADGLTVTITRDSNGDGKVDQTETDVTQADGSKIQTIADYDANGNLLNRTVITTSFDGLTQSTQQDENGNNTISRARSDVTVINLDGSKTETIIDRNSDNTIRQQAVVTTSADGLSTFSKLDGQGKGFYGHTETMTVNADGSTLTVAKDVDSNGKLLDETDTIISADRHSKTVKIDSKGTGVFNSVAVSQSNIDGSISTTITDYNDDKSVKDRAVTTLSADGRTKVIQIDSKNAGTFDLTTVSAIGIDGSKTVTSTNVNGTVDRRFYDSIGNLDSETITAGNGSTLKTVYKYGIPVSTSYTNANGSGGQGSSGLGSAYGAFLGGNSMIGSIGRSYLIGQLGQAVAKSDALNELARSLADSTGAKSPINSALSDSAATTGNGFVDGVDGMVSSLLLAEAAQALGIRGFAGTVFTITGSAITKQLLINLENIAKTAVNGATLDSVTIGDLFKGFDPATFFTNLGDAIGGAAGSYLGSQVVAPTNIIGAIGGQIGSTIGGTIGLSIGTALGGPIGGIIGDFIGSFIGDVLGTLFGDLFGPDGPPSASITLGVLNGTLGVVATSHDNGGEVAPLMGIAGAVDNMVDTLIGMTGGKLSFATPASPSGAAQGDGFLGSVLGGGIG
ncbi:MAG: hypothetical protein E6614_10620, partial [Bradyrhizobium sp.]|nr:hypothetical protein [Bradyrhizobium sp.]